MASKKKSLMASEIAEIPAMLERQCENFDQYWDVGCRLKKDNVRGFVTCARGTSNHAATFFKYLMETKTGLPVASVGPSVASVYKTDLQLEGFACVSFSQSGGSPDITALQKSASKGGALTVAVLNKVDSPVGKVSDIVLPVLAGPELAVAATKSFVGMLFSSLAILAGYKKDKKLKNSMKDLPKLARQALRCKWSKAASLARYGSLYCLGRGMGLAVAEEAALKFKETCQLHAEAYSAAESLHGPVAIAHNRFSALAFGSRDKTGPSIALAIEKLNEFGADVFLVQPDKKAATLKIPKAQNKLFDPLLQSVAFYKFVEKLAVDLGENPDAPIGLKKVTETV